MCSMTETTPYGVHTTEPIHARVFDGSLEDAPFVPFPVELLLNMEPGTPELLRNAEGGGEHGFLVLSVDEAIALRDELDTVLGQVVLA